MATKMLYLRRRSAALAAACLWAAAGGQSAWASEIVAGEFDPDARIDRVLEDTALAERIEAWGISVAELRADVDSLSEVERETLATLLEKSWVGIDAERQPAVTAQYLATIAMMRESSLFISVITNWLGNPR